MSSGSFQNTCNRCLCAKCVNPSCSCSIKFTVVAISECRSIGIKCSDHISNNAPERLNAFLQELSTLCKKYEIGIHGCGCCGSPYLSREGEENVENVQITDKGVIKISGGEWNE